VKSIVAWYNAETMKTAWRRNKSWGQCMKKHNNHGLRVDKSSLHNEASMHPKKTNSHATATIAT